MYDTLSEQVSDMMFVFLAKIRSIFLIAGRFSRCAVLHVIVVTGIHVDFDSSQALVASNENQF